MGDILVIQRVTDSFDLESVLQDNGGTTQGTAPDNRLSADMSPRDWLELMYGTPDRIEPTEDGGLHLVWVFTRHTQEHRPDPHQETYVEEAHVRLDAAGEIVDARRNSRQSND